jgi:hypothetical protein
MRSQQGVLVLLYKVSLLSSSYKLDYSQVSVTQQRVLLLQSRLVIPIAHETYFSAIRSNFHIQNLLMRSSKTARKQTSIIKIAL